jgi:hypothetical protein
MTGISLAVKRIGTALAGSFTQSRILRWAWGSLPSTSSRITHVVFGASCFKNDKNDTEALQESLNIDTSSCDRRERDAFTSRGSYPQERAAAKTNVVLPIPGVPEIKTLLVGAFSFK